ncbi:MULTISPECIES: restriction endonuclease subunit S [unclassified Acinetobacter]|uniref:restriction endonuclease subunit S n=1 Tax=unclassified Acinetobacter TaxID=196816 RepID=UPI0015D1522D|nr:MULTISPECIES: restriction endonuclease subunit S [unclassified Acinetobacter]
MMFEKYDAYKDSGMDWIGEIPHDWNVVKLKHLLQEPLKYGANESGIEFSEDLPRYIRITDFNDDGKLDEKNKLSLTWKKGKDYLLDDGDILLARSGASVGKSFLFKLENANEKAFCFAGYLIKAKADINKIIPKYLYLYLNSEVFFEWKNLIFNKATIENIGADKYSEFFIILPSLDEQSKILDLLNPFLMNIDQAIAIKEQQIALFNERKQIVIQKAVTQGLDPNVPMKDSGVEWIGQIPEHWEIIKVKNLFKLIIEPAPKNNDLELLSVYTDIGVKPRKELEERGNKASTTDGYWKVKKGDIIVNKLLAWMGAIGLSNYDGVTSPAYDILRATKPLNPYIYHLLFRSPTCSAELKKHSRGIMDMRLRLYFDKFGDVLVPYAPIAEQNEIIKYIEVEEQKINAGIELINQQIEKLKEYKTTLINDAVTGKIKVA